MPMLIPVTMLGSAPFWQEPPRGTGGGGGGSGRAPRLRELAMSRDRGAPTPWIVAIRIGNSAPMYVMKIMLSSADGNIRIASGSQATPGMGRRISSGGRQEGVLGEPRPADEEPEHDPRGARGGQPREDAEHAVPEVLCHSFGEAKSSRAAAEDVGRRRYR